LYGPAQRSYISSIGLREAATGILTLPMNAQRSYISSIGLRRGDLFLQGLASHGVVDKGPGSIRRSVAAVPASMQRIKQWFAFLSSLAAHRAHAAGSVPGEYTPTLAQAPLGIRSMQSGIEAGGHLIADALMPAACDQPRADTLA
jgi:hypothetical protein